MANNAQYIIQIQENESKVIKLQNEAEQIKTRRNKNINNQNECLSNFKYQFNSGTVVISASANERSLGRIIKISSNIDEVFGYSIDEF